MPRSINTEQSAWGAGAMLKAMGREDKQEEVRDDEKKKKPSYPLAQDV